MYKPKPYVPKQPDGPIWVEKREVKKTETYECPTCKGKGRGMINNSRGKCLACDGKRTLTRDVYHTVYEDITQPEPYSISDIFEA